MEANEIVPGRDLTTLDDKIVELRNKDPKITYAKMAEALDDSPTHIAARVRSLIKTGEIKSRGGPGYRPEKGE